MFFHFQIITLEQEMKLFFIGLFLFTTTVFADCDLKPLRQEMMAIYQREFPITDNLGKPGVARVENMQVSDYLLSVKSQHFLVANFEVVVRDSQKKETVIKTVAVGDVDIATCSLEKFTTADLFGSSISGN
jgi:fructose-1-phosphate kinase PfkB-like protein